MADDRYRYDPQGKGYSSQHPNKGNEGQKYYNTNNYSYNSSYGAYRAPPKPRAYPQYKPRDEQAPYSAASESDYSEVDERSTYSNEKSVFYVVSSSECKSYTGPGLFSPEMGTRINLKLSTAPDRIVTYTAAQLKIKQYDFHLWTLSGIGYNKRLFSHFHPKKQNALTEINGEYLFAEERGVGSLFPNSAPSFQGGHLNTASVCLKYYNKSKGTCSFVTVMSGFWNQQVSKWLPFVRRVLNLKDGDLINFFVERELSDVVPIEMNVTPLSFGLKPGAILIAADLTVTAAEIVQSFSQPSQIAAVEAPGNQADPVTPQKKHQQQRPVFPSSLSSEAAAPNPNLSVGPPMDFLPKITTLSVSSSSSADSQSLEASPPPKQHAQASSISLPPETPPLKLSTSNLSSLLESHLECPICFEMMLPPIYQCANGHCLCQGCHKREEKCPICRVAFDREKPIRALVLEKFAEAASVPYPCKYRSNGCQKRLPTPELLPHEATCIWRRIDCPALKKECKHEVVTYGNVLNHLEQHHGSQSIDTNNSKEAIIEVSIPREDRKFSILRIVDNTLLLSVRRTELGLAIYARHVPVKAVDMRYTTSILSSNGLIFSYGGPTIDIVSDISEPSEGPCLFLHEQMLKNLVSADQSDSKELKFQVYVKWSGEIKE